MVERLAHLDAGHPERNFARVEVAEEPPLETQQQRRMDRVTQVEQHVRTSKPVFQFGSCSSRSSAWQRGRARRSAGVGRAGSNVLPGRVAQVVRGTSGCRRGPARGPCWRGAFPARRNRAESFQAQRPLQRHGEVPAAEPVLGRETRCREKLVPALRGFMNRRLANRWRAVLTSTDGYRCEMKIQRQPARHRLVVRHGSPRAVPIGLAQQHG